MKSIYTFLAAVILCLSAIATQAQTIFSSNVPEYIYINSWDNHTPAKVPTLMSSDAEGVYYYYAPEDAACNYFTRIQLAKTNADGWWNDKIENSSSNKAPTNGYFMAFQLTETINEEELTDVVFTKNLQLHIATAKSTTNLATETKTISFSDPVEGRFGVYRTPTLVNSGNEILYGFVRDNSTAPFFWLTQPGKDITTDSPTLSIAQRYNENDHQALSLGSWKYYHAEINVLTWEVTFVEDTVYAPSAMYISTNSNWESFEPMTYIGNNTFRTTIRRDKSSTDEKVNDLCFKLSSYKPAYSTWGGTDHGYYGPTTSDAHPVPSNGTIIESGSVNCWKVLGRLTQADIAANKLLENNLPGTYTITATYIDNNHITFNVEFTPEADPAVDNPDTWYLIVNNTAWYPFTDTDSFGRLVIEQRVKDPNSLFVIAHGDKRYSLNASADSPFIGEITGALVESTYAIRPETSGSFNFAITPDGEVVILSAESLVEVPEKMFISTNANWNLYTEMAEVGRGKYQYSYHVDPTVASNAANQALQNFCFTLSTAAAGAPFYSNNVSANLFFSPAYSDRHPASAKGETIATGYKNCWKILGTDGIEANRPGTVTITARYVSMTEIVLETSFTPDEDAFTFNPEAWYLIGNATGIYEFTPDADEGFYLADAYVKDPHSQFYLLHDGKHYSLNTDAETPLTGSIAGALTESSMLMRTTGTGSYRFRLDLTNPDEPYLEMARIVYVVTETDNNRVAHPMTGMETLTWTSPVIEGNTYSAVKFTAHPKGLYKISNDNPQWAWDGTYEQQFCAESSDLTIVNGDKYTAKKGDKVDGKCWKFNANQNGTFTVTATYRVDDNGDEYLDFVTTFTDANPRQPDTWYYTISYTGKWTEFQPTETPGVYSFTSFIDANTPIGISKGTDIYCYFTNGHDYKLTDQVVATAIIPHNANIKIVNADTYTVTLDLRDPEVPTLAVAREHFFTEPWSYSVNISGGTYLTATAFTDVDGPTNKVTLELYPGDYVYLFRGATRLSYGYGDDTSRNIYGSHPEEALNSTSIRSVVVQVPGLYTFIVNDGAWTNTANTLRVEYAPFGHGTWPEGHEWAFVSGTADTFHPLQPTIFPDYTLWEAEYDITEFSTSPLDKYIQVYHHLEPCNATEYSGLNNSGYLNGGNIAFHDITDGSTLMLALTTPQSLGKIRITVRKFDDEETYQLRIKREKADQFDDSEPTIADIYEYSLDNIATLDVDALTMDKPFNVNIQKTGIKSIEANFTAHSSDGTQLTKDNMEYHWVKYENPDWYKTSTSYAYMTNPGFLLWLSDTYVHPDGPHFSYLSSATDSSGKPLSTDRRNHSVDRNVGSIHDCRNFTDAFYRVYGVYAEPTAKAPLKASDSKGIRSAVTADHRDIYSGRVAMTIPIEDNTSGIEDVILDENGNNSEVTAQYYNLQGIRIMNPRAGEIYIMKRGATVSKIRY